VIDVLSNEILLLIKKFLRGHKEVVFAYLHGSYARNEEHPFSDIDIAVYLRENSFDVYMDLLGKFPEVGREIDLRVLNDAPPLFKYKVIKEGKLLVNKDPELLKQFIYETLIEALEIKDIIEDMRKRRIERLLNAR